MDKRTDNTPVGAVEIPNEPVDLSQIHPSLHKYYGDGMPLKTYRTSNGAIVRIFGACLPKTKEENRRNIQRAWEVANRILDRAAVRYALEEEERIKAEQTHGDNPQIQEREEPPNDRPTSP